MADKEVFVVFGATGIQGGSVINSVLSDLAAAQEFRIRGITRDPTKPNAQALTAAQELYENLAFMDEFGYYGKDSLDWSHSLLDEKPTTLKDFIAKRRSGKT
ncbi:MAG: hypothetical protein L6R35_006947 [Caloplaca aegaea]|nr:MAG: hypothetical protein L6R35_006947 [Caloplaca aegaea]